MKRLLAILMLCLLPVLAAAEPWYIEAAIGPAHHYRYHSEGDNYWRTDAYPGESYDMDSLAWRLGIGRKLTGDWSKWSVTTSLVNLGRNSIRNGRGVADDDYDSNAHRCLRDCDQVYRIDLDGSLRGFEFAVRRQFNSGFYGRGGVALLESKVLGTITDPQGMVHDYAEKSMLFTPFIGGGFRYKALFAEVSFYQGMGTGFPLAKRVLTPMVGGRMEF